MQPNPFVSDETLLRAMDQCELSERQRAEQEGIGFRDGYAGEPLKYPEPGETHLERAYLKGYWRGDSRRVREKNFAAR